MSRIGNTPVVVPKDVTIDLSSSKATVKGPKGELIVPIGAGITVKREADNLIATRTRNDGKVRAAHGTTVALLTNAIVGVTKGWTKQLELQGVGYRATLTGTDLTLTVGFSHPVVVKPSPGITFTAGEGKIVVSGIDKYLVGQVAATIRAIKPPEPYKGKGIRYTGEHVRKKAGKSAKAVGGASGGK
jgi:large subunit ribosomal protein L6